MSLISALRAQPAAHDRVPDEAVDRTYRRWRVRTMYSMMTGYALFYFVRKNFSMAMPAFGDEFGYTKTDLGWLLTLFSVLYGVGKLVNGTLADRANPRYFMAIGLLGSAAVNVAFGLSHSLFFFSAFWLMNAWFQSMGWPPCARLLTHWYGRRELGTWWGIWNASHQIGGAGIVLLAGYLVSTYGWRSAFYVPAALAAVAALFVLNRLRDTPRSLGLPPIEVYRGDVDADVADAADDDPASIREILFHHVLNNRFVWLMSLANFFVYIVRIGMLDWAPTFLTEAKGSDLAQAGWQVAGFEIVGIFGGLAAGAISDRVFRGHRAPVNVIYMICLAFVLVGLWYLPAGHFWLDAALLMAIGFLVYGPQMLTSVAATDYASKKAAATATGMVGLFGYLGSAVCGVGTGWLVDNWGWNGGFALYLVSGLLGTLVFAMAMRRPASPASSPV